MIMSKLYNKLDELGISVIISFVLGIVAGVMLGCELDLIFAIVYSLCLGIILMFATSCGFEYILLGTFAGIIFILTSGIIIILMNLTEALPFIDGMWSILGLIFIIFILVEILFWLSPSEKVKKKNLIKHTLKRKAEALFEVLFGLLLIAQAYIIIREVDFIKYFPEILKWIVIIIASAIALVLMIGLIVGIGCLWIKLNSLKYKK